MKHTPIVKKLLKDPRTSFELKAKHVIRMCKLLDPSPSGVVRHVRSFIGRKSLDRISSERGSLDCSEVLSHDSLSSSCKLTDSLRVKNGEVSGSESINGNRKVTSNVDDCTNNTDDGQENDCNHNNLHNNNLNDLNNNINNNINNLNNKLNDPVVNFPLRVRPSLSSDNVSQLCKYSAFHSVSSDSLTAETELSSYLKVLSAECETSYDALTEWLTASCFECDNPACILHVNNDSQCLNSKISATCLNEKSKRFKGDASKSLCVPCMLRILTEHPRPSKYPKNKCDKGKCDKDKCDKGKASLNESFMIDESTNIGTPLLSQDKSNSSSLTPVVDTIYYTEFVDSLCSIQQLLKSVIKPTRLFDLPRLNCLMSLTSLVSKQRALILNCKSINQQNSRKTATVCMRELKRACCKVGRTNPLLKGRKIYKDLLSCQKKSFERPKSSSKAIKKELEEKEVERAKRKLNFLLNQTELFSHFMAKKYLQKTTETSSDNKKDNEKDHGKRDKSQSDNITARDKSHIDNITASDTNQRDNIQLYDITASDIDQRDNRQIGNITASDTDQRDKRQLYDITAGDNGHIEYNQSYKSHSGNITARDNRQLYNITASHHNQGDNGHVDINDIEYNQRVRDSTLEHVDGGQSEAWINTKDTLILNHSEKDGPSLSTHAVPFEKETNKTVELFEDDEVDLRVARSRALCAAQSVRTNNVKSDRPLKEPPILKAKLKPYQLQGLQWLHSLYEQGINGILADDMGLGKTVQAISFLCHLSCTGIKAPFLVVTPASTLHNWASELKRFAPSLSCIVYAGSVQERKALRKGLSKAGVVVASYQAVVNDFPFLKRTKFGYLVLDEAQALKSAASLRWRTLLQIDCSAKLLLTGTPVQNTMAELWALLHFIMPTLFDNLSDFAAWFSKDIEAKRIDACQLQRLHAVLRPFMLRRVKDDVKDELGVKREVTLVCEMSHRQKRLYARLRSGEKKNWTTNTANKAKGKELEGGEIQGKELDGGEIQGNELEGGEIQGKEFEGVEIQGKELNEGEMKGGELEEITECEDREDVDKLNSTNTDIATNTEVDNHPAVSAEKDCDELMNVMMQFRKVCNHPDIFEREEVEVGVCRNLDVRTNSGYVDPGRCEGFQVPVVVADYCAHALSMKRNLYIDVGQNKNMFFDQYCEIKNAVYQNNGHEKDGYGKNRVYEKKTGFKNYDRERRFDLRSYFYKIYLPLKEADCDTIRDLRNGARLDRVCKKYNDTQFRHSERNLERILDQVDKRIGLKGYMRQLLLPKKENIRKEFRQAGCIYDISNSVYYNQIIEQKKQLNNSNTEEGGEDTPQSLLKEDYSPEKNYGIMEDRRPKRTKIEPLGMETNKNVNGFKCGRNKSFFYSGKSRIDYNELSTKFSISQKVVGQKTHTFNDISEAQSKSEMLQSMEPDSSLPRSTEGLSNHFPDELTPQCPDGNTSRESLNVVNSSRPTGSSNVLEQSRPTDSSNILEQSRPTDSSNISGQSRPTDSSNVVSPSTYMKLYRPVELFRNIGQNFLQDTEYDCLFSTGIENMLFYFPKILSHYFINQKNTANLMKTHFKEKTIHERFYSTIKEPIIGCTSYLETNNLYLNTLYQNKPQVKPTYFKQIPRLDDFISSSGKLVVLDCLLQKLKEEKHRVLIYFQMTKMMDLMEDYLIKRKYSYLRLDGSCRIKVRKELIEEWQSNDDRFIFILSTRAGGLGINLTAADTVVFYDSDWNPTVDQQAMDRAYRLGQTKDVTVYRLIMKDTIEERIMEKATEKGEIQKMVIRNGEFSNI